MAERLRIGLFVDQFPELSETFISGELLELERLGHAVHVEAASHAPHPDPTVRAGVSYRDDDARGSRLAALAWLVARQPLRCARDLVSQRRWRREERVVPLRRLAPSARRVARFGASHLHAHFAAGAALDAMRVGALLDLPYSVMTHGYDIFQTPANLREKHERAAFAVSACDYSVRWLRERVGDAQILRLVTGVDGERFERRKPYSDGSHVLAVGRLVEKKGFDVLIEAAASLTGVRVTVVGDGPLRAQLEQLVASLGAPVELAGARSPEEVRALLEDATLLAAPCVVAADGDRDTMPVVVKEALAMGVPVVASDEVGLPEVVRPDWGRLVTPNDAAALATAIRELLELPRDRRAEMGRAGRDFVLEHCSLSGESRRLAALIAAAQSNNDRLRTLP
ncbi:MAG TPA: glycosyltransferase [Thermoleophilaceae bacterium]|nr:glycosyltransferase [Thermoleophilaceae bacterium]